MYSKITEEQKEKDIEPINIVGCEQGNKLTVQCTFSLNPPDTPSEVFAFNRTKIRLTEGNAKYHHLKKLTS
jgi:hypothetical protein